MSVNEKGFYNTTLEVLDEGERVLGGQNPVGCYSVSEYVDGEHVGGSFHRDIESALDHMRGFNRHGPDWEDENGQGESVH